MSKLGQLVAIILTTGGAIAAAFLILSGLATLAAGFALPAFALVTYGAASGIWSIARGAVPLELFGGSG